MYKCLDCGHVFDEGEQMIEREYHNEIPGGYYEEVYSCPMCGGDFNRTYRCLSCGSEHLEDELISGLCEECFEKALTYENFLDFATSGAEKPTEIDTLEDFIFVEFFQLETPKQSSIQLKKYCDEFYRRRVADEKLLGKTCLKKKINDYFLRVFSLRNDFVEFIFEKETKK